MAKLVSKIYGEALFEIAMEESKDGTNKAAEMLDEVKQLKAILDANPEFGKLMTHPSISKQEKQATLETVFKDRISDEMTGFLETLLDKDRYNELDAILDYFIAKIKEAEGIGVAYVTTAVELTRAQRDNVQKRLLETTPYKSMEMNYTVDPEIIGGMLIRIGDRVVDTSIRTKLDKLTKQLLQIQLG